MKCRLRCNHAAFIGVTALLACLIIAFVGERDSHLSPNSPAPRNTMVIDLSGSAADVDVIPLRHSCNGMQLVTGSSSPGETLKLLPSGIYLGQVSAAEFSNMSSFTQDCEDVVFATPRTTGNKLMYWDILSRKLSIVAVASSTIPTRLIMKLRNNTSYYPTLAFIYSIDASHLLLSFNNPSTGGDAYTNWTSQAIYDVRSGALTFISYGGGSPPVLLLPQSNLLIMPDQDDETYPPIDETQIDLVTGSTATVPLNIPYRFNAVCQPAANESMPSPEQCDELQAAGLIY